MNFLRSILMSLQDIWETNVYLREFAAKDQPASARELLLSFNFASAHKTMLSTWTREGSRCDRRFDLGFHRVFLR